MQSVCIIDYGMANLRSVQKAFERVGCRADIVGEPARIAEYDRLVLPGVGAFKDAIGTIRRLGFDTPIRKHIAENKPFLGICLGLQMLFDVGFEDGEHRGLGILSGRCVRFDVDQRLGLKVPHMGWNQIDFQNPCPLFNGIESGSSVYFVHSFYVVPDDPNVVAATTDYGVAFVSAVCRGNLFATQFHPEKSQRIGLQMLENFANLAG